MEIQIQHDEPQQKFYAVVNGEEGIAQYRQVDANTLEFYHTYVPPALRGQQLGEKIVQFALDYAKEKGYKIIPTCPFVRAFVEKHPEYQSLQRT